MSSFRAEVVYLKLISGNVPLENRRLMEREGYDQEVVAKHQLTARRGSTSDPLPVLIHFVSDVALNPKICFQPDQIAQYVSLTPRAQGGYNQGFIEARFVNGPETITDSGLVIRHVTQVDIHPQLRHPKKDRQFSNQVVFDAAGQRTLRVTFNFED